MAQRPVIYTMDGQPYLGIATQISGSKLSFVDSSKHERITVKNNDLEEPLQINTKVSFVHNKQRKDGKISGIMLKSGMYVVNENDNHKRWIIEPGAITNLSSETRNIHKRLLSMPIPGMHAKSSNLSRSKKPTGSLSLSSSTRSKRSSNSIGSLAVSSNRTTRSKSKSKSPRKCISCSVT